jgi:hypothetical protein
MRILHKVQLLAFKYFWNFLLVHHLLNRCQIVDTSIAHDQFATRRPLLLIDLRQAVLALSLLISVEIDNVIEQWLREQQLSLGALNVELARFQCQLLLLLITVMLVKERLVLHHELVFDNAEMWFELAGLARPIGIFPVVDSELVFKITGAWPDIADTVDPAPDLFCWNDSILVACTLTKHCQWATPSKLNEGVNLHSFFGKLRHPAWQWFMLLYLTIWHRGALCNQKVTERFLRRQPVWLGY